MALRATRTRVMHRSGLERPHFVARETVAVAPAHKLNPGFVRGVFCRRASREIPEEPRRGRESEPL
jgi:hypothetical protein